MIEPFNSKFLLPNKLYRRLSVLLAIRNKTRISQHQIAKLTHLSSSMVNNYMKELQGKKWITMSGKTNRTQSYHLTPGGQAELISLLLHYSSDIIQLYAAAKREVAEKIKTLCAEGVHKVALFGAAETAEVVHAAAKDLPLQIEAIVDSNPDKQGLRFNGLTIQAPEELKGKSMDAILITSFARQTEIQGLIKKILGDAVEIWTLSDL
ncbi:MAG: winged helix-turn-helix transcriptional regulator [Desulfobacteraceae bacterium]|nr:MAG: winged helix-turn-helix transcriptional regulator [Desulfobacteraceae bacterium]